jgi:hypothetical protein
MIYDEAIEFGMGDRLSTTNYSNFLVFMNYSKNDGSLPNVKTKFYTHCYQTIIGWFHTQGNKWGCVWGHKKVADWKKPTNGEAPAKQRVLEKSITKESFLEKKSKSTFNNNDNNSYETNFIQIKSNLKNKSSIKSKSLLKMNSSFKNHAEIARRINSLNLGWTAKVYDNIQDKSLGEMNDMYGKFTPNSKFGEEFRFKSKVSNSNSEENFYNNYFYSSASGKA